MRSGIIVASTRERAQVHGVHGATGLTYWACLARRTGLHGGWEAIEWACLPPGGVSGEHLHTRTEELYLLLTGHGEISLDGRRHRVTAGDAVLTGLGTRHGLRNTGDEPLEWLVIELTAVDPTTAPTTGGTPGRTPDTTTGASPGRPIEAPPTTDLPHPLLHSTVVTNLRRIGPLDPRVVLTGPLRSVEVVGLNAAERIELAADGVEHTVFVTAGSGHAGTGEVRVPLAPGTSITLPLGTAAALTAGLDGLEYVHAVLTVPTGGHS
ncbi:cupin domain-containing protein [Kitasatospora sp. LaBMicrA B282]|uniref:cupin domain-containing protein n=1 Tax=Kitasatospora sp. LaBMicrA B282 TaxID=3420949 RepID=UPI003D113C09